MFFFIPVYELGESRFSRLLLGNWGKCHAQRRIFFVMSQNMYGVDFYKTVEFQGIKYSIHNNTLFNNSCIQHGLIFGEIKLIYLENSQPFAICENLKVNRENFTNSKNYPPLSCFRTHRTSTYFKCLIKNVEKTFFMELNDKLHYINFFSSYHLFT